MAHSRWITTANRILRLYVSTTNPTTQLHMLAEYVAKVYAPMWFKIKFKPSCKDGARHVFETVHRVQGLPQQVKQVVEPVIQRNAYFAHPENLLLSMLSDQRMHIRELGLRRILKARTVNSRKIRKFDIPKLNFDAQDYTDLIDWQNVTVTSPPLLMKVPDDEVKASILSGNPLEFEKLPCHTQAVERCIKLVTEASTAVCGAAARDGFINVRNEARKKCLDLKQKTTLQFNIRLVCHVTELGSDKFCYLIFMCTISIHFVQYCCVRCITQLFGFKTAQFIEYEKYQLV
jgi:hypothetical protein